MMIHKCPNTHFHFRVNYWLFIMEEIMKQGSDLGTAIVSFG